MFGLAFFISKDPSWGAGQHYATLTVQPIRIFQETSEIGSRSKHPLHCKNDSVVLDLLLEQHAFFHRQLNLTAHHVDICKYGLTPCCREWFYVLGGNQGILEVKIQVQVTEIHAYFLVWICEVSQHCKISIQQVTHVQVSCIPGHANHIKMWATWSKDEIDYKHDYASYYND